MHTCQLTISSLHFWVGATRVFFKALSTVYESKIKSKGAPIALWYVYVQITNESVNGVYYNNFRYGCLACCEVHIGGFCHEFVWFGERDPSFKKKLSMYLLKVGNFDP